MATSTQSSLLKTLGAYGGVRVVGDQTITGKFMAIHALDDTVILSGTTGNIENFIGSTITLGDVIVGSWTTLHITGEAIVYYEA
jgi:hypothetical protein